jgi:hypothetical protein
MNTRLKELCTKIAKMNETLTPAQLALAAARAKQVVATTPRSQRVTTPRVGEHGIAHSEGGETTDVGAGMTQKQIKAAAKKSRQKGTRIVTRRQKRTATRAAAAGTS